jgi:hypothetical protein
MQMLRALAAQQGVLLLDPLYIYTRNAHLDWFFKTAFNLGVKSILPLVNWT